MADDVLKIELEARKKSLEEYKHRCQDLRAENEALKKDKEQRENDALQIISFLRRDAERKDELIESLKNTINQQREVFAQEKENEKRITNQKLKEQDDNHKQRERGLQQEMKIIQEELNVLQEFKEQKAQLETDLENGRQERIDMEVAHKETIAAMERKFFEEKAKLQKEAKQMLAEIKKSSQEEAVERLDSSTKKILFENRRMAEELRLQVQETDELQKLKRSMDEENRRLRREVQLNEQSVKEYAKQGFRQSKEIKDLTAKVKSLERSLSQVVREFERDKEQLTEQHNKKSQEMELDTAGLRQLVKLKSKELANVKKLAQLILEKRNEVETFLLEALEYVKLEIGRQRSEEDKKALSSGARSRQRLPTISSMERKGGSSHLPTAPDERVDIKDLTWEDRERVLRLLFAKINNSEPFQYMPPHVLDLEDPTQAMMSGKGDQMGGGNTYLTQPPDGYGDDYGGDTGDGSFAPPVMA